MFRQVVAYRWIDGATDAQKAEFRDALAGLRAIPELIEVRFADDARHFDGNFDVVAVMDFPDFTAARRYVADDRHQAYIRDHASKLIGERVVVQHDWAVRDLVGVHHLTLPVSDLPRSREWYRSALGLVESDGVMRHPSVPVAIELVHDPVRANALAGFNAVTLAVGTNDDLDAVVARLDGLAVAHSDPTQSDGCIHVEVADPDGLVVQLRTLLP